MGAMKRDRRRAGSSPPPKREPAATGASGVVASLSLPAVMGLVFLAALLVRVVTVLALRGSPFFDFLLVDAQWHHDWAAALARGDWSPEGRAFFRAPLYPFWLSLIYRLFGEDLLAARLVQAVLGAATASLLAGAAWRLAGRRAALAAGAMAAFYGPFIFFDGELLIPNLLLFLLSGALFLLLGFAPRLLTAAAAGLLLGLAGIARPNALVLIPAALWILWLTAGGARARRAVLAAALLAPALAPAGWVTWLNHRAEGVTVFIASQGGINFYAGNHADANGRSVEIPELGGAEGGWAASRRVAEETRGRSLNSREVSDFWFERGRAWIRSDPAGAVGLTLRKAYYLVNAYETPNNRDLYTARPWPLKPFLWRTPWLAFPWGLVFPLAMAGAVIGWRRRELRRTTAFLSGWILLYGLSLLPFFVCARFRLGLVPAVILLAALALAHPRALRGWPLAAGLAALILVNSSLFDARAANPAQELTRAGSALLTQGRITEGRALLEQAVASSPASAKNAFLLAQAYDLEDRAEEAVATARRSLELEPASPAVLAGLGAILLRHQLYVEAEPPLRRAAALRPGSATTWADLGRVYEGLDQAEDAIAAFEHAIAADPGGERGYLDLGYHHREAGALALAIEAWGRGTERCPESASLWFNLALALAETGDRPGALRAAENASRLRPDDGEIRGVLRWLREKPNDGP
jgi:4-amino-4-deoxy-L-arabinose transferase-like glycosyltransferase